MAVNVEDAGFILKDCIMWLYGSGFPKATDISKQLDKIAGAEREVVGKTTSIQFQEKGYHYKGSVKGSGFANEKYWGFGNDITKPTTPEAQQWNGWKSHGLKPAYEPIIVAMKPNEGTYANNALKWGVSGLNIDGGRIGTETITVNRHSGYNSNSLVESTKGKWKGEKEDVTGRFPANIILDEVAAEMLDEQSGVSVSNSGGKSTGKNFGGGSEKDLPRTGHNDKGGASRFFYVAKASKSERNAGCEGLEEKASGGMSGTKDQTLLTGSGNIRNNKATNHHPTVKPIKLMQYLCELTKTPTGGVVLDPFM